MESTVCCCVSFHCMCKTSHYLDLVFRPPLEDHVCLLDCIALDLQEMDIFAAERLPCQPWDNVGKPLESDDLNFPSYSVRRTGDNLLKDCCRLKLKVERNLDKYALLHFLRI